MQDQCDSNFTGRNNGYIHTSSVASGKEKELQFEEIIHSDKGKMASETFEQRIERACRDKEIPGVLMVADDREGTFDMKSWLEEVSEVFQVSLRLAGGEFCSMKSKCANGTQATSDMRKFLEAALSRTLPSLTL